MTGRIQGQTSRDPKGWFSHRTLVKINPSNLKDLTGEIRTQTTACTMSSHKDKYHEYQIFMLVNRMANKKNAVILLAKLIRI